MVVSHLRKLVTRIQGSHPWVSVIAVDAAVLGLRPVLHVTVHCGLRRVVCGAWYGGTCYCLQPFSRLQPIPERFWLQDGGLVSVMAPGEQLCIKGTDQTLRDQDMQQTTALKGWFAHRICRLEG